MQDPTTITTLDLSEGNFDTRVIEIEQFVNLESIDLSYCSRLDWVDTCRKLAMLPKLAALKATDAHIEQLPVEFGSLIHLKKIDLSDNKDLTRLPESFSALLALEDLSLHGCGLTHLSNLRWHFPGLHTLDLICNDLETLPDDFFGALPALQHLFLEDNKLIAIPKGIGELKELRSLFFGNNYLHELPASLCLLNKLDTVGLNSCTEMDLTKELSKLKDIHIKELLLFGNQLRMLPAVLKEFRFLEVLELWGNLFEDTWQLVKDLSTLPLKKLDIRFMGTEDISLEKAQTVIPTLEEIACDINTGEGNKDPLDWLKELTG